MSPSNTQYRMIFSGEIQPGENIEVVANRLAVLLKMEPGKARHLVSGRPTQVRKNLNLQTAEKLKKLVVKAGADCYIQRIGESLPHSINRSEPPESPRRSTKPLRPHSQPIGPASEAVAPTAWNLEPVVFAPPRKPEKPEPTPGEDTEPALGDLAMAEIEKPPPEAESFKKPETITCPKCGCEQPAGEECRACGIVFRKYQARVNQVGKQRAPRATHTSKGRPKRPRTKIDPGAQALQDLERFVGPNARTYMDRFDNFRGGTTERFALTWHWPALFVPFFWAIYRKLWLWALLMFISSMFLPLVSNVGWALSANYIYFRHARNSTQRVRRLFPKADPEEHIAQAGGTSAAAVWVAVVLIALLNYWIATVVVSRLLDFADEMGDAIFIEQEQARDQLGPDLADDPDVVGTLTALGFTGVVVKMWFMGPGKGRDPDEVTWSDMELGEQDLSDAWGNPIRYQGSPESFELRSAGPDGAFNTRDDIAREFDVH